MEFIETSIFTKQVQEHLNDNEYKEFQKSLIINPAVGDLIRSSGGLRKVRWNLRASGKRGGIRVIYYWHNKDNLIFLLLMYRKNVKENLSPKEIKILKQLMETF